MWISLLLNGVSMKNVYGDGDGGILIDMFLYVVQMRVYTSAKSVWIHFTRLTRNYSDFHVYLLNSFQDRTRIFHLYEISKNKRV